MMYRLLSLIGLPRGSLTETALLVKDNPQELARRSARTLVISARTHGRLRACSRLQQLSARISLRCLWGGFLQGLTRDDQELGFPFSLACLSCATMLLSWARKNLGPALLRIPNQTGSLNADLYDPWRGSPRSFSWDTHLAGLRGASLCLLRWSCLPSGRPRSE